jgi:hypothetical protein
MWLRVANLLLIENTMFISISNLGMFMSGYHQVVRDTTALGKINPPDPASVQPSQLQHHRRYRLQLHHTRQAATGGAR